MQKKCKLEGKNMMIKMLFSAQKEFKELKSNIEKSLAKRRTAIEYCHSQ